jgi:hypothetical protein
VLPRGPQAHTRIGHYAIERELARGGMGVVYVARHMTLGRQVALKLMLDGVASARSRRRFETEATVVAQLNHPGIVKIHEVGMHGDDPYIVMDLIDGESLEDRIARDGPLDPQVAARICRILAHALEHAHARDVLHRDIKPANILIASDGRPLITDFGLAKDLSEEREKMTRTGQMLGTPAYLPPEQAVGRLKDIGPWSDVYSLGATLFSMLTGEPPFKTNTLMATLAAVVSTDPDPPSAEVKGVPPDLDAITLRCLEKATEARYPNAAALAQDLERFLSGAAVEATLPGLGRRARSWLRRRRLVIVGSVGVLAIVGALASSVSSTPSEQLAGGTQGATENSTPVTAPPRLTPAQVRAGSRALADLRGFSHPKAQAAAADEWLASYATHPETAEVELIRDAARLLFPIQRWKDEPFACFLPMPSSARGYGVVTCGTQTARWRDLDRPDAVLKTVEFPFPPRRMSVAAGRLWVLGPSRSTRLFSVAVDGTDPRFVDTPMERLEGYTVSPDGTTVAVSGRGPDPVVLLEVESSEVIRTFDPHRDPVKWLTFSPNGRQLITLSGGTMKGSVMGSQRDNAVRIFAVEDGALLLRDVAASRPSRAIFVDSRTLVVGTNGGSMFCYDTTSLEPKTRTFRAEDIEGSKSGDGFIAIRAVLGSITGLALSEDGKFLWTCVGDVSLNKGGFALWDLESGDRLRWQPFELMWDVTVSPDGEYLLIRTEDDAQVWIARPGD